jgi:hypothetical protein
MEYCAMSNERGRTSDETSQTRFHSWYIQAQRGAVPCSQAGSVAESPRNPRASPHLCYMILVMMSYACKSPPSVLTL